MSEKIYQPNIAIHPGDTLFELLETVNMTQAELAERTGLTLKTVNEIVQGKNSITPETANKFSAVFGMSAIFWNNLQRDYEETLARLERDKIIKNEIPYLAKFVCYKELVDLGFVEKTVDKSEKVKNLLNFFGVSSLFLVSKIHSVAFRKVKHKDLDSESLAAWLRCGELDAQKKFEDIKTFDKESIKQSLHKLRALTVEPVDVFQKKMVEICSNSGIMVNFTPYFKNTYVSWATRWANSNNPLIQLSLRGSFADSFWFTFFHELGHIIKHGKKDQFLELDNCNDLDVKEQEADEFAQELLIPRSEYMAFVQAGEYNPLSISKFANKLNIDLGIVAGRLARDPAIQEITWKNVGHLRSRLKFSK
jgi:HTH-type transcriptional regulator/antitoxin HigA